MENYSNNRFLYVIISVILWMIFLLMLIYLATPVA